MGAVSVEPRPVTIGRARPIAATATSAARLVPERLRTGWRRRRTARCRRLWNMRLSAGSASQAPGEFLPGLGHGHVQRGRDLAQRLPWSPFELSGQRGGRGRCGACRRGTCMRLKLWLLPKVWLQGSQSTRMGGSSCQEVAEARSSSIAWLEQSMRCVLITALGRVEVEPEVNRNFAMVSPVIPACAASTSVAFVGVVASSARSDIGQRAPRPGVTVSSTRRNLGPAAIDQAGGGEGHDLAAGVCQVGAGERRRRTETGA